MGHTLAMTPLADGRSCDSLLQPKLSDVALVGADVSAALSHLHSCSIPIAHGDVKLANFLLHGDGPSRHVRLCDFGSAQQLHDHATREFTSGDVCKADVWALGTSLTELLDRSPFRDSEDALALRDTIERELLAEDPDHRC